MGALIDWMRSKCKFTHNLKKKREITRFLYIHAADIDVYIPKALSNFFCTCISNGTIDKYPRIFMNLIRKLILKAVLVISFRDRYGYANEVLLTNE